MTENAENVMNTGSQPTEVQPAPRAGLWALVAVLGGSYVVIQLVVSLPILWWLLATNQIRSRQDALNSPVIPFWALIALGVAAIVTILIALNWPALWRRITQRDGPAFSEWVSWRDVQFVPLWAIVLVTPPVVIAAGLAVSLLPGASEANLQAKLFATEASRIVGLIVAPTVVPIAEELIFRGALFNALLPQKAGMPAWQRYLIPVVVTSTVFAGLHWFSGVNTLPGILEITVLSFYLSGLRALTGSVKSSIAAHMTWNILGALAYSAMSLRT